MTYEEDSELTTEMELQENSVEIKQESQITIEDEVEQNEPEPVYETITEQQEEVMENNNQQPVYVHTKFGNNTITVQYLITATGQYGNTSASGGKLRLIFGRIYFLPTNIDEEISSDHYGNIKVFSDMADKVDVKFVAKGHAAILPLQNNVTIQDNTRLCALW